MTVYLEVTVSIVLERRAGVNSLDAGHGKDTRTVHEIADTTWCGNEDVTALSEFLQVVLDWNTAVGTGWAKHGTVAETASFIEDLLRELTSWYQNDNEGLGADAVYSWVVVWRSHIWTRSLELSDFSHEVGDDGDQVSSGLSRTGLGDGDDIFSRKDSRDAVCLNCSSGLVPTTLHVFEDDWVQPSLVKLGVDQRCARGEVGWIHLRYERA